MSAFLDKKLGAKKTIIIVNNYTYINILPKNFVDIALSPQRLTVSMVLQHLAKGDVPQEVIFKMQSGAEAIEGIIHKNKFTEGFFEAEGGAPVDDIAAMIYVAIDQLLDVHLLRTTVVEGKQVDAEATFQGCFLEQLGHNHFREFPAF